MKIKLRVHAIIILSLLVFASALNALSINARTSDNQQRAEAAKALRANKSRTTLTAQESAGTRFKGSVADAKFEMSLRREGDELKGSYFYSKSGSANSLSLRGKIDASGNFTMQEFDSSGKQTGEFKGKWKDDPNQSGAYLEGEWKKPDAKESQIFWASEQMISFTKGTQLINRQLNESIEAKRLDLNAEYPELSGGANVAGFNQLVKARVSKEISEFRKMMMNVSAEDVKTLPQGVNHYIEIGYSIEYADNDLISVNFFESTYTGGVHPNSAYFTITYDLKNGRELKLSELFKPGAKYLETISAYATKDLQSRKAPDSDENMGLAQDLFADGATAKDENYQSWNITKKGLMFTFDPYQVGPYSAGPQTVIVPYDRLRDMARTDGVLAKMMK